MTEPIRVRRVWSTPTKVILTLAILFVLTPVTILAGMGLTAAANAASERNRPVEAPSVKLLPACDDDAPDPSMTKPCVWEDDNTYWVMDGKGNSKPRIPCATEDSVTCVWDAATRGNRSASVDSAKRFVVNQ